MKHKNKNIDFFDLNLDGSQRECLKMKKSMLRGQDILIYNYRLLGTNLPLTLSC